MVRSEIERHELKDPLCVGQVTQTVLAEILQRHVWRECLLQQGR